MSKPIVRRVTTDAIQRYAAAEKGIGDKSDVPRT